MGHDRTLIRSGVLSRQEKQIEARTIRRKHGRDRMEQAATILSRLKARTFRRKHGHDRTEQAAAILSRQEARTFRRKHSRGRTEQAAAILSRQRFRQRLCVARSAAFQHSPKTVTQYDDYERITTFFLSPLEQKEGFRQTGARRHAFGEVMRKVSVRQTPKSAYGAQLQEIHR